MTRRRFRNDPPRGAVRSGETVDVDSSRECEGGPAVITGGSNHVLDPHATSDTARLNGGSNRQVHCVDKPRPRGPSIPMS